MARGERMTTTDPRSDRLPLDLLVERLRDPQLQAAYRRELSFRKTSGHVNPLMLAVSARDSMYVRDWRSHAERCAACRRLFAYFDLT